jgi:hypothetical protein
MSLLALILWAVISGSTVVEYWKQPLDYDRVNNLSIQTIQHTWFTSWDNRQVIIQEAYKKSQPLFILQGGWDDWR